jgi:hypothetical protein
VVEHFRVFRHVGFFIGSVSRALSRRRQSMMSADCLREARAPKFVGRHRVCFIEVKDESGTKKGTMG